MELIIDANIVMSALIATEGKTFDLVYTDRITLFAPEFLLEELDISPKFSPNLASLIMNLAYFYL